MAKIDYYFSLLSPFVFLANGEFEKVAAKHGAEVTYKPFDIIALYDRLGVPRPADRPEGRKVYRMQELKRLSAAKGLEMNFNPSFWPTNAAPASYAVIAAQKAALAGQGGDLEALVAALSKAVWVQEKDIADDAVITEALKGAGFDPMLSMTGMLEGAEVYAQTLEDALSAGVFGSPFYIVTDTDERFWGQDRIEMLDDYLATL